MKQYNTSWFSIVLALGLTLLLSFTGLYLLEYMVPFSRNIKGIENASKWFYQSYGWIEDALFHTLDGNIWDEYFDGYSGLEDFSYQVTASGTQLPPAGEGNSNFTSNRNKISQWDSIQLLIWADRLPNTGTDQLILRARIPDLDGDGNNTETFDTLPDDDIIFWQLSSSTDSLSASWSLIDESDINANGLTNYRIWNKNGVKLDGTDEDFGPFYNTNCRGVNECVLKISVIHPLILSTNDTVIPYLEYRIDTSSSIPLRYAYIESNGKAYSFTKELKVAIPQQTTNSAFDFTVFQ